MSYPLDQPIRLQFLTYSDEAQTTLADATSVTLYVTDPAGVETTPTPVHDSTGTYHYDLTPSLAGHYKVHWKATGAVATSSDEGFDVVPRYGQWICITDVDNDLNLTGTSGHSSELRGIIDAACTILENHPAYNVADNVKQTVREEWYDAGSTIVLRGYPVSSIASVVGWNGGTSQTFTAAAWDSGLTPAYGYAFDASSGLLHLTGCYSGRVLVTYTTGVTTVPADIRLAALLLVEHLWETQRGTGGQGLPSGEQLPEGQPDFTFGSTFILPNRVREALQPYVKAPAVA